MIPIPPPPPNPKWTVRRYPTAYSAIPEHTWEFDDEADARATFQFHEGVVGKLGGKVELWPPNSEKWVFQFSMMPAEVEG